MFLTEFIWKRKKSYLFYKITVQLLIAAVPLADTIIPKFIIDELLGKQRAHVVFAWVAILLAINLLFSIIIRYLNGRAFLLNGKLFTDFQIMLAEKLSKCDFERLEDPEFLDSKSKAENFLYANGQGFAGVLDNVFNIFGKLVSFVGVVAIIARLNIFVVIGFVLLILLNTYFESKVRQKIVEWDMEKAPVERRTSYFLDLIENFAFGKEIRIYGLRKWILSKARYHLLESESFYEKQTKLSNRTSYISSFMNFLLKGITYVYLAVSVLKNSISIGDFTMYMTALMGFSEAMTGLMSSLLSIRQYGGYYSALNDYMNVPQKMYEGKGLKVPVSPYEIKFEDVSFRYAGQDNYALKNISLTISSGQKLSVVGENGAGKTTFVKLLCRLYDPTSGRITLNGVDIRDIAYDEYMGIICSVFQDFRLLAFSMKENVAFMNSEAENDGYIKDILVSTGLGERVNTLNAGIHTNLYRIFSDSGFEPSGGEGQRIALARAIYKNAPIMILDEPTAALDPRAEYEIYLRFSEMTKGKTTVFISHRLASSKFCDKVALFSNGEIIEYGTHEELILKEGCYKELFEMQAQYYQ